MKPRAFGPWRGEVTAGRGAHGIVTRARHASTGQLAAVKTVTARGALDRARVGRELRMLQHLRHPDIVELLDHDVDADEPWLALRWVEGPSLEAWIPTGPLTPEEVRERLDVIVRLCTPLAWLHGEGRVHRDLKPANVHVENGRPVLLDLGIAAVDRGPDGRDEAVAAAASASGTYAYMAPEQARGEVVDARADLYALGCVLWVLLTGRPPFRRPPTREREPPRLSRHDAAYQALDPVMARLLAHDPARRFGHADEVAHALTDLGARPDMAERPRPRDFLFRAPTVGRDEVLEAILSRTQGAVLVRGPTGMGRTRVALEIVARATRARRRVRACDARPLAAVRAAIEALAQPGEPELIVIDDLHRLPDELLGPLDQRLREGPQAGRVLVMTCRDDPMPSRVARWVDDALVEDRPLAALNTEQVGEMIRHALARPSAPSTFAARVHGKTSGHPWFVDAWLRAAVDAGQLFRDARGAWSLGGEDPFAEVELQAGPVPSAIRAVFEARLERLSTEVVDFLVGGACLGHRFRTQDAAAVAGMSDGTFARAEAIRASILEDQGEVLCFRHALWVELLSERQPADLARRSRAARCLRAWGASPLREGELHEAIGDLPGALQAYHRAVALDDPERVAAAWKGIARCTTDVGEEVRALYQAGYSVRGLLRETEAIELLERAVARSQTAEQRLDAVLMLGRIAAIERRDADAVESLEAAVVELGEDSPPSLLFQLGCSLRALGRHAECVDVFDRALRVSEATGDAYHAGLTEAGLGLLERRRGDLEAALAWLDRARVREYSGLPPHRAAQVYDVALGNHAVVLGELGEIEAATRRLAEAERHASSNHLMVPASRHAGNRGIFLLEQGRLEEAIPAFSNAIRLARIMGRAFWENAFLGYWLRACRFRGDPVEALAPSAERLRWLVRDASGMAAAIGWIEIAHVEWYAGRDGSDALARARAAAAEAPLSGKDQRRLALAERAAERHAAGLPLLRGQCPEDIPDVARR